jgi:hypothetical protein
MLIVKASTLSSGVGVFFVGVFGVIAINATWIAVTDSGGVL